AIWNCANVCPKAEKPQPASWGGTSLCTIWNKYTRNLQRSDRSVDNRQVKIRGLATDEAEAVPYRVALGKRRAGRVAAGTGVFGLVGAFRSRLSGRLRRRDRTVKCHS